jgi:hypothetical protein
MVGSTYQYQGQRLQHPEVIFVQDHHYDQQDMTSPVQALLANSECATHEHLVVFDHVVQHDDSLKDFDPICMPLYLIGATQQFNQQQIQAYWGNKTHTFNFMINKPRLHREFLLVLISHFELQNYVHTLCWKQVTVSQNLGPYTDQFQNATITVPPRQWLLGQENLLDRGLQYGHVTNSENYQRFLQQNVFEPSCVSLITEPAFRERETIVTEKTIMALLGGTLPIWVGGWRIADYMRSLGFDIFDDMVDHTYQNLSDPWDRCYHAVARNLSLLQNLDQVKTFFYSNQHRFQHNLDLIRQNVFQTAAQDLLYALDTRRQQRLAEIPEIQELTCNK